MTAPMHGDGPEADGGASVVALRPAPETAAQWCARLHAEDVTPAERRAFNDWLNSADGHRADYELAELAWVVAQGLSSQPALLARLDPLRAEPAPPTASRAIRRRVASRPLLAAMAAGLVAGGALFIGLSGPTTYSTATGQHRTVALADGSTVDLNTDSTVSVNFSGEARRVTLRRGEAFFSVAPDARRPFYVQAGASLVRVVGTRFDVRLDGDRTAVTVLQGHVRVVQASGSADLTAPAVVDLLPGQAVRVAPRRPITPLAATDPERSTSWRQGKIAFDAQPLADVVAEINRYTPVRFVVDDAAVAALPLSGSFRTGDVDSVLFALRETYGLTTRRDGEVIHVSAAPAHR